MLSNRARSPESGFIISSKGNDPSHFKSKSSGSEELELVSRSEWDITKACYLTDVVMSHQPTERETVLLVIFVMHLRSLFFRPTERDKVSCQKPSYVNRKAGMFYGSYRESVGPWLARSSSSQNTMYCQYQAISRSVRLGEEQ